MLIMQVAGRRMSACLHVISWNLYGEAEKYQASGWTVTWLTLKPDTSQIQI
jgi:hypothetical protein